MIVGQRPGPGGDSDGYLGSPLGQPGDSDVFKGLDQLERKTIEYRVTLADAASLFVSLMPLVPEIEREQIDAQFQEIQRVLGLAEQEGSKA